MLFNSQIFLLGFLPVVLTAYYLLARLRLVREWLLIFSSLFFYAYWDIRLLPLIIISMVANWIFVYGFFQIAGRGLIPIAVTLNLLVIGIFKYADFFAGSLAWVIGTDHQAWNIILPLGISFFTFQQISYLVDVSRNKAPLYGFREYCLYVSFFPQLIAGPIVRHDEFIFQLERSPLREGLAERLSRGSTLLVIGLIKKVLIADSFAKLSDQMFSAANGGGLSTIDAWLGALAFSFQIYFDFSGYSDMAIGLALLFGLTLPVNFNIPYIATSIQDFWRRWHITLSHFLRDYLYIPLGGSWFGPTRQASALAVTMLLGGLWHGAAWTFVLWGGLHGLALIVQSLWHKRAFALPSIVGWFLTMLFLCVTWVLFRAENFAQATSMLESMLGTGPVVPGITNYAAAPWGLAIGAIVALVGPSSQRFCLECDFRKPVLGVVVGLAFVFLALKVGSDLAPEFIYFQF